jgi:hypothetical protein
MGTVTTTVLWYRILNWPMGQTGDLKNLNQEDGVAGRALLAQV